MTTVRTVKGCCVLNGADLHISFDANDLVSQLKEELEDLVKKRGIQICWQDTSDGADFTIRFLRIDQGNLFLRWLAFLSPVIVEAETEIVLPSSDRKKFHHYRAARRGAGLAVSGRYLAEGCVISLSREISNYVLYLAAISQAHRTPGEAQILAGYRLPTWALTLGLLGSVFNLLTSVPAVFCGILALQEIRKSPIPLAGKSRAIAGIIIGVVGTVGWITFFIVMGNRAE